MTVRLCLRTRCLHTLFLVYSLKTWGEIVNIFSEDSGRLVSDWTGKWIYSSRNDTRLHLWFSSDSISRDVVSFLWDHWVMGKQGPRFKNESNFFTFISDMWIPLSLSPSHCLPLPPAYSLPSLSFALSTFTDLVPWMAWWLKVMDKAFAVQ